VPSKLRGMANASYVMLNWRLIYLPLTFFFLFDPFSETMRQMTSMLRISAEKDENSRIVVRSSDGNLGNSVNLERLY
jgi:hypothetical protein